MLVITKLERLDQSTVHLSGTFDLSAYYKWPKVLSMIVNTLSSQMLYCTIQKNHVGGINA